MLWLPLVVGIGIAVTVFQAEFREEQPSWAVLLALGFTGVVLLILMPEVASVVRALTALAREGSVGSFYLNPVLKAMGAAYVTSFGVQISQEAGEAAISSVIELAGKLVILFIALPLLQAIVHTLFGILGL
ncbi:MAG: SpoIIIAC/SpoIIIAD family protein [Limnochordia bacterium]|nr:SpoIIIAC/SpoIIIAD family protein [Bacillota bacterium]NLL09124.1 stage III sporulation protein AD [Bacillota bacterium]HBG10146.1 stage III sporulation protein AD [Bacillota bacterium]